MLSLKRFINFYQAQDGVYFWSTASSVLIALVIIGFWAIYFPDLPSRIPLFYSLPWGEKQLGTLAQFLIIPAIIFLVTLTNLIVSWHLHPTQLPIKRMLMCSTVVVSILLFITAIKIIATFV